LATTGSCSSSPAEHRTPVIALNIEREVITQVRKTGLDSLPPGDRSKLPERVDLQSEAHRQLFAAFMGGAHGGGSPAEAEGMFRAQCTWDAVMAHNAVKALAAEKDPRAVMVVMAGIRPRGVRPGHRTTGGTVGTGTGGCGGGAVRT
jgi:uncharacterized iron-regulated protein